MWTRVPAVGQEDHLFQPPFTLGRPRGAMGSEVQDLSGDLNRTSETQP
jgi:hypothetical protein